MQARHGIRENLEAARRTGDLDSVHAPHLADPAPAELGDEGVVAPLGARGALAKEVDAPGLGIVGSLVADLGEGDPHLERPPLVVDLRRRRPHRVPGVVELVVVVHVHVALHVGGADPEHVARQAVEIGVQVHAERVRLAAVVPPVETGHDALGLGVPHPRRHPDRTVSEEDAHLGVMLRRRAFHRLLLREAREQTSALPRRLVDHAVDLHVFGHGREGMECGLRGTNHRGRTLGSQDLGRGGCRLVLVDVLLRDRLEGRRRENQSGEQPGGCSPRLYVECLHQLALAVARSCETQRFANQAAAAGWRGIGGLAIRLRSICLAMS